MAVQDAFGPHNHMMAYLHLCTNKNCIGSTVAYYLKKGPNHPSYKFHRPEFQAHTVHEAVPPRPREILQNANDARGSPIACTTTAVRAVEAMMAEKGYRTRKLGLKGRIAKAIESGDLPKVMGDWAEEVRELGVASHTDEEPEPLSTKEDAERALLFANTLADYLFVMPARILEARKPDSE
ncbi:MAG: DUF4145 domain-containing protein [Proteobacteria bacterium]|nr:DUF4145 domain-containing protein [Pseudomonadota bacterium]